MKNWQPIYVGDGSALVSLTLGMHAIVDADDVRLLLGTSWQARWRHDGKTAYASSNRGVRMHRLILGAQPDQLVDHRDHDGLNNRRKNLRLATHTQNSVNRRTQPGRNLKGAFPHRQKWCARIKIAGRSVHIGSFDTEAAAHEAYLVRVAAEHGEFAPSGGML